MPDIIYVLSLGVGGPIRSITQVDIDRLGTVYNNGHSLVTKVKCVVGVMDTPPKNSNFTVTERLNYTWGDRELWPYIGYKKYTDCGFIISVH